LKSPHSSARSFLEYVIPVAVFFFHISVSYLIFLFCWIPYRHDFTRSAFFFFCLADRVLWTQFSAPQPDGPPPHRDAYRGGLLSHQHDPALGKMVQINQRLLLLQVKRFSPCAETFHVDVDWRGKLTLSRDSTALSIPCPPASSPAFARVEFSTA